MRRTVAQPRVLTAAATLFLIAGSALATGTTSAASAGRASSPGSASGLLNQAFADARAKGSFHQALTQDVSGVHGSKATQGTLADDVTLSSGRQAITSSDGTRAEVEVIGRTAYMTGNLYALKSFFKFTTNQVAVIGSNWVSVPSTNTAFASIAYDVTASTALAEVAPSGHLTEGRRTTIDGQRVIAITGGVPSAFAGGADGKATIYVTVSSDPLPVSAMIQVTQSNNSRLTLAGTMSDWGEHVRVTPPTGRLLTSAQISLLVHELSGLAIPGEPGYFAAAGQHGKPVATGRPWGQTCKPVRLAVAPAVPDWIYTQIAAVAGQARKQGIDVTVENRRLKWSHGSLYYHSGQSPATTAQVDIGATGTTPSTSKSKQPMRLMWNSRIDADKRHEDLTSVSASFSLPAIHNSPQTVRRSIRQLIAWTQGISETTDPISGITLRSFTDRFTSGDVAAMLAMSGCAKPSGNTVIGIAA
jgi:hypothetical protein